MPAVIEGVDRRALLSTIVLDVLATEEVDLGGEVTKYPVEDGTTISDHIFIDAEVIRIAGSVSLADVLAIESGEYDKALDNGRDPGRKMVDVIYALRKLRDERAEITFYTAQMLYAGYGLQTLNAIRSSEPNGGNWLTIKAELVKLNKVQLKTAQVPTRAQGRAAGRSGQTNQNAGRNGQEGNAANRTPFRAGVRAIEQQRATAGVSLGSLNVFPGF